MLHPTPEKLCSEADFPRITFWPCSAVPFFIRNAGEEDLGGCWGGGKNNGHKNFK